MTVDEALQYAVSCGYQLSECYCGHADCVLVSNSWLRIAAHINPSAAALLNQETFSRLLTDYLFYAEELEQISRFSW